LDFVSQHLSSTASKLTILFTTSVSLGKGRGQHAAVKMMVVVVQAMPNGPIRAEQVNRNSSVIG
jgi:hypothetical protein